MASIQGTLMPFLYPCLSNATRPGALPTLRLLLRGQGSKSPRNVIRHQRQQAHLSTSLRLSRPQVPSDEELPELPRVHTTRSLDPTPDDYSSSIFADQATLTVQAGSGGNGCVSFLREKFIAEGPPNGGDGGTGGNVYISAVPELKSLHKVVRQREVRAGNGRNGMGKSRGGQRGDDVVLEVPIGTIVREIARWDPVDEAERAYEEEEERTQRERAEARREEKRRKRMALRGEVEAKETQRRQQTRDDEEDGTEGHKENAQGMADGDDHYAAPRADMEGFGADAEPVFDAEGNVVHNRPVIEGDQRGRWRRDRWLLQPSSLPSDYATANFPALPRPRRSNIAAMQPPAPIMLDLSKPTQTPILLAAGAMGGLGNPHFATKSITRPKFATKGNVGMKIKLQLELKLLADLGFVGLPNAGKSTLLRALSNSRARVGSWAFTTLVPNLGTVVLDDNKGRAKVEARDGKGNRITGITVADIPGLVEGASQDRGLGLDFLRHVERAKVLAFVVDLGAGDGVEALKGLWKELDAYERLRERTGHQSSSSGQGMVDWGAFGTPLESADAQDGAVVTGDEPVMWKPDVHDQSRSRVPALPTISEKPWFVVATKADLDGTQANFTDLQNFLAQVTSGQTEHPAGQGPSKKHRWTSAQLKAIPVSAIHGHGIERVVQCAADLLSA